MFSLEQEALHSVSWLFANVSLTLQELRKLVRKVHSALERSSNSEENKEKIDEAVVGAKKSLARFLRALAKSSLMITL